MPGTIWRCKGRPENPKPPIAASCPGIAAPPWRLTPCRPSIGPRRARVRSHRPFAARSAASSSTSRPLSAGAALLDQQAGPQIFRHGIGILAGVECRLKPIDPGRGRGGVVVPQQHLHEHGIPIGVVRRLASWESTCSMSRRASFQFPSVSRKRARVYCCCRGVLLVLIDSRIRIASRQERGSSCLVSQHAGPGSRI